jgi:hypothetical protein
MPPNEILSSLRKSRIVKKILLTDFDGVSNNYILKVEAELKNGWKLDCFEHRTPSIRRYSFQVSRGKDKTLRWDNAPHHPDLKGFPCHKHEGKDILNSNKTTVDKILAELENVIMKQRC